MPQLIFQYVHAIKFSQLFDGELLIISVLKMRELRHRKVK